MRPVSLLIKPASGSCNMRCSYCFYADEMRHREVASYGIMQPEVLDAVLQKAFSYAEGQINIGFQGGEPTLTGLDFYRQVMELEERYKRPGLLVQNAIQTNGLCLDRQWADFFAEHRFLVGLSIDGTKDIHDICRKDLEGKGTFNRVLRTAQLLSSRNVEFNILTVVTSEVARRIGKVYGFFRKNNLLYQQYIPCLDPLESERGKASYSLSPSLYSKFLKELFHLWYLDRAAGKFIYIRYFENLLMMLAGQPPESCGLSGRCINQLVVEADGSVYPCDFYVLDSWRLGNLATDTLEEIITNSKAKEFIEESAQINAKCKNCQWGALCRGGCKRDRIPVPEEMPIHYYCEAMQEFLAFAFPKLLEMLRNLV